MATKQSHRIDVQDIDSIDQSARHAATASLIASGLAPIVVLPTLATDAVSIGVFLALCCVVVSMITAVSGVVLSGRIHSDRRGLEFTALTVSIVLTVVSSVIGMAVVSFITNPPEFLP